MQKRAPDGTPTAKKIAMNGASNLIKRYFNTLEQWKDIEIRSTEEANKDLFPISSDVAKKRKRSVDEESIAKKKMKGCIAGARPWDRNAFVQRLSTFSISRWFGKPRAICALECATHGWTCSGIDSITCDCCGACLHFDIADDLSSDALAAITRTYSAQLRDGHKRLCGWRDSPCPTGFGTFPAQTQLQLLRTHEERSTSLDHLPQLPPLNAGRLRAEICNSAAEASGSDTIMQALGYECRAVTGADCWEMPRPHQATARVLAAFGWQASPDTPVLAAPDGSDSGVLHCALCLRTCGSWNYAPPQPLTSTSSKSTSQPQQSPGKRAGFDPVKEHRWFCPWVTAASRDARAASHEKLSGWQQCVRALATKFREDAAGPDARPASGDCKDLLRKSAQMYQFLKNV